MLNVTTSAVRRLCVSIAGATPAEALALAKEAETIADVIEIRLDGMADPDIPLFLKSLSKPLLFTNRPAWEGGNCTGEEMARINLLKKGAEAGAAYVDIELNADPTLATELIGAARANNCKTIVSWHDFKCTASSQALSEIFQRQCRSGGMISRVATADLGGYMTYAAPDNGPATAPGQLPASSLRRIFTELEHAH